MRDTFENLAHGWRPYGILTLLCAALFLPGLSVLPPTDRDEARYAQAAKQMLETGDFVRIRFHTEPRNKKPIGIYWLQAVSASLSGDRDRIWPYRIPSLLGALLAVLLTFELGRTLFDRATGLVGAALLASCLLMSGVAHAATTDAALLAATFAAVLMLARAYTDALAGRRSPWWVAAVFWLALGVGILIKGPMTPLVCLLTAGGLTWRERSARWLTGGWSWARGLLAAVLGLLLCAAVVCPWFIAINRATGGAFIRDAVGRDFLPKLISGQESHGAPPGYYLLFLVLTFWPGSLFIWDGLARAWQRRAERPVWFCLASSIPLWVVLELVPTKLPHYILPAYPALALLSSAAMLEADAGIFSGFWKWVRRVGRIFWFAVTVTLTLGVVALGVKVGGWTGLLAGGIAAGMLLRLMRLAWGSSDPGKTRGLVGWAVGTAIVASAVLMAFLLPRLDDAWLSRSVARVVEKYAGPLTQVRVAATGYEEPSLVFLLGTQTRLGSPSQTACDLATGRADLAVVPDEDETAFQEALRDHQTAAKQVAVVTGYNYSTLRFDWRELKLKATRLTVYATAPE